MQVAFVFPQIQTDEDKIKFLLALRQILPNIITDSARYNFDLWELLDDQKSLVESLQKIPAFNQLFAQRPPYLRMEIRSSADVAAKEVSLNPAQFARWKSGVEKTLHSLPEEGDKWQSLINEFKVSVTKIQSLSQDGIFVGLVRSLPAGRREQAYRLASWEEKISFIRQNLTNLEVSALTAMGILPSHQFLRV